MISTLKEMRIFLLKTIGCKYQHGLWIGPNGKLHDGPYHFMPDCNRNDFYEVWRTLDISTKMRVGRPGCTYLQPYSNGFNDALSAAPHDLCVDVCLALGEEVDIQKEE